MLRILILLGYNTPMPAKKTNPKTNTDSVIVRSDNGTIQITFTIPFENVKKSRDEAAKEFGKDLEVPGFRKGNAPVDKVIEHVPQNTLLEKTLSKILPKLLADAINVHKIKPAIYPKFELVKAQEGEDWQVRAVTCEIPKIELGDYKKDITGINRAKSLWVPGKVKEEKEPSREEKEQQILKTLIEKINLKVPKVLIEEEVNSRLAKLLERLEKLGLSLESYLASINKTSQTLRQEYEKQSQDAISIDLILSEVAQKENLTIETKDIDAAINAAQADPKLAKELDTPDRRKFIEAILRRRKALDYLTSLM